MALCRINWKNGCQRFWRRIKSFFHQADLIRADQFFSIDFRWGAVEFRRVEYLVEISRLIRSLHEHYLFFYRQATHRCCWNTRFFPMEFLPLLAGWNVLSGRSSRSTKRSRAWTNRSTMSAGFVSFAHLSPLLQVLHRPQSELYCASLTFTTRDLF